MKPYIYGAAALIAVVLLYLVYHQGVLSERKKWQMVQAKEQVKRAADDLNNEKETNRRLTEQKEIAENATLERNAALLAADNAAAAGNSLRKQVRNLAMSLAAFHSDTPASGEAAQSTIDLLDGVWGRNQEAMVAIARYADESVIAGKACEASYGALEARN